MNVNLSIVKELEEYSLNSTHHSAKIAAAIVYKNKIISIANNIMKSSPFQKRFSKNESAIFFHAETFAIQKALRSGFTNFSKSTLYIVRTKWDSSYKNNIIHGNAQPCSGCLSCVKTFNIKSVIYTLDDIEGITSHFGEIIM